MLKEFLYQAIFQREGEAPLPHSIIYEPEIYVFIDGYGQSPHDHCLVAEKDGLLAGAVWTRILHGKIKGFGNVDGETPEFAISLLKEYRGAGIGTQLMLSMLALLREKGCQQASLAVQKDNYAVKMYEKCGFTTICENEEEYIMLCSLKL